MKITTKWLPLNTRGLLHNSKEMVGSREFNVLRSPSNLPRGIRATFDEDEGYAEFELRYPFEEPGVMLEADGSEIEIGRRTAKLLRIKVPIPEGTEITAETIQDVVSPAIKDALEAFARRPKRWLVRHDNMEVAQQLISDEAPFFASQVHPAYAP